MAEVEQLEFAWKLHDNLSDWTARVDVKASIALAIEAAVLGFVITLTTDEKPLAGLVCWPAWILLGGVAMLGASVLLAILVVFPQLRGRHLRSEYQSNYVYFGHLRLWEASSLASRLESHTDDVEVISRQLVRMSEIVWRKHVWLQWSLSLLILGVAAVAASYVMVLLESSGAP